jgi:hypothetical protein
MQPVESYQSRRAIAPLEISCEPMGEFDGANLEMVQRAFQSATPCLLGQAWLEEEQPGFSPATVRTGWRGNSLFVFAELPDWDIFSRATRLNQRTWELGDAFEIFLASSEAGSYIELHVTPGNQRLQLRYRDSDSVARARRTGALAEFLIPGEAFRSTTWIESDLRQWNVLAEIPAAVVCDSNSPMGNAPWRFSFGRYDYTRGEAEPCISSTSPHAQPDFHRRHEWGVLNFKMHS